MRIEIRRASGGQYYWRMVAADNQVLATSETYYNKAGAIAAAESVVRLAAGASIRDLT
jgi:uncharacterized protein YegP (UPF0339 family)